MHIGCTAHCCSSRRAPEPIPFPHSPPGEMALDMLLMPDTNVFIHFKAFDEMPWSTVTAADHIRLVIGYTVAREIDKLKDTGKGRDKRRARGASSLIGEMVLSGEHKVLREAGPRVTIELAGRPQAGWEPPSGLNPSRADDQVLSDILAFREKLGQPVGIMTADNMAFMSAADFGLRDDSLFLRNDDAWRLPPEPDDRDIEVRKLREQVAALQSTEPRLNLAAIRDGAEVKLVEVSATSFRPLTHEEIQFLGKKLKTHDPIRKDFSWKPFPSEDSADPIARFGAAVSQYGKHLVEPSEAEISKYESDYGEWAQSVENHLSRLHLMLSTIKNSTKLTFLLSNEGTRHAENLGLTFSASGGLLLDRVPTAKEPSRYSLSFPKPPQPPQARMLSIAEMAARFPDPFSRMSKLPYDAFPTPGQKDLNSFYWRDGRPHRPTNKWAFDCASFPHLGNPEPFNVLIYLDNKARPKGGSVDAEVASSNVRDRLRYRVSFRVAWQDGDTLAEIVKLLPSEGAKWVGELQGRSGSAE